MTDRFAPAGRGGRGEPVGHGTRPAAAVLVVRAVPVIPVPAVQKLSYPSPSVTGVELVSGSTATGGPLWAPAASGG
ncbi:hypothetical protein CC117_20200 [Parafrankia colletiae]|uniref:Uncharacterized protein n=1 Tax=Parafrankia colletiae TaxID=573497 RepID=A0A1S1QNT3_9ACTN|nr:hypothetical protein CC117_20200 [Parafrankia colletiae]